MGSRQMKSSEQLKAEWETNVVNDFISSYSGFPFRGIKPIKLEAPDFVLQGSDYELGIEVVRYKKASGDSGLDYSKDESLFRNFLPKIAKKEFEKYYPENPFLVYFDRDESHKILESNNIAQKIAVVAAQIIAKSLPKENSGWITIGLGQLVGTLLEEYGISMRVSHHPLGHGSWNSAESGQKSEVEIDQLEGILEVKGGKVNSYLKQCNIIWLLIVADGYDFSSMVSVPDTVKQHFFHTNFYRVAFFNLFDRSIFTLNRIS
jgi:hypothetical protein